MDNFKEIYVVNTICNATSLRQNSAVEVAKKVDLMLVIGGKIVVTQKVVSDMLCFEQKYFSY